MKNSDPVGDYLLYCVPNRIAWFVLIGDARDLPAKDTFQTISVIAFNKPLSAYNIDVRSSYKWQIYIRLVNAN